MPVSNKLFVIFMSCENLEGRPQTLRPFGLTKPELARLSFVSLWKALNASQMRWKLVVEDNSSSPEFRKWMQTFYGGRGKDKITENRMPVDIFPIVKYADRNLQKIVGKMDVKDDDWVFFAEDDHLYTGDCLWLMREFANIYGAEDFALVPYVQTFKLWFLLGERQIGPQVIQPGMASIAAAMKHERPRLVLRTPLSHWMQVWHANGTLLARAGLLRKWWSKHPEGLTHAVTSSIFETTPCFAPIPSLSTHLQEGCESPGFTQKMAQEWLYCLGRTAHDGPEVEP